jgi:hypothetical protein
MIIPALHFVHEICTTEVIVFGGLLFCADVLSFDQRRPSDYAALIGADLCECIHDEKQHTMILPRHVEQLKLNRLSLRCLFEICLLGSRCCSAFVWANFEQFYGIWRGWGAKIRDADRRDSGAQILWRFDRYIPNEPLCMMAERMT